MTVPRAEHQPVFAEPNQALVAVDCRVPHIKNGQMNAASRFELLASIRSSHLPYVRRDGRLKASRTTLVNVFRRWPFQRRVSLQCGPKIERINRHHLDG